MITRAGRMTALNVFRGQTVTTVPFTPWICGMVKTLPSRGYQPHKYITNQGSMCMYMGKHGGLARCGMNR
jgi:hypothetical protein